MTMKRKKIPYEICKEKNILKPICQFKEMYVKKQAVKRKHMIIQMSKESFL